MPIRWRLRLFRTSALVGGGRANTCIDEVERIWSAIADQDDWEPLADKVSAIRRLGDAPSEPPIPAGHK